MGVGSYPTPSKSLSGISISNKSLESPRNARPSTQTTSPTRLMNQHRIPQPTMVHSPGNHDLNYPFSSDSLSFLTGNKGVSHSSYHDIHDQRPSFLFSPGAISSDGESALMSSNTIETPYTAATSPLNDGQSLHNGVDNFNKYIQSQQTYPQSSSSFSYETRPQLQQRRIHPYAKSETLTAPTTHAATNMVESISPVKPVSELASYYRGPCPTASNSNLNNGSEGLNSDSDMEDELPKLTIRGRSSFGSSLKTSPFKNVREFSDTSKIITGGPLDLQKDSYSMEFNNKVRHDLTENNNGYGELKAERFSNDRSMFKHDYPRYVYENKPYKLKGEPIGEAVEWKSEHDRLTEDKTGNDEFDFASTKPITTRKDLLQTFHTSHAENSSNFTQSHRNYSGKLLPYNTSNPTLQNSQLNSARLPHLKNEKDEFLDKNIGLPSKVDYQDEHVTEISSPTKSITHCIGLNNLEATVESGYSQAVSGSSPISVRTVESVRPLQVRKLAPLDLSSCIDSYVSEVRAGPFYEDSLEDYDAMKLEEFLEDLAILEKHKEGDEDGVHGDSKKRKQRFKFRRNKNSDPYEGKGVPEALVGNTPSIMGGPYKVETGKAATPAIFYDDGLEMVGHTHLVTSDDEKRSSGNEYYYDESLSNKKGHRHRLGLRHFKSKRKGLDEDYQPAKEFHTTLALETVLSKVNGDNLLGSAGLISPISTFHLPTSGSLYSQPLKDDNLHSYDKEPLSSSSLPALPSPVALSAALDPSASSGFESVYCLDFIIPEMEKAAQLANFSPALFGPDGEEIKWMRREYETRKAALVGKLGVKITGKNTSSSLPSSSSVEPGNDTQTYFTDESSNNIVKNYNDMMSRTGIYTHKNETFTNRSCSADADDSTLSFPKTTIHKSLGSLSGLRGMGSNDGLTGLSNNPAYGEVYSNYGNIAKNGGYFSDIELGSSPDLSSEGEITLHYRNLSENANKVKSGLRKKVEENSNIGTLKGKCSPDQYATVKSKKSFGALGLASLRKKKSNTNKFPINDSANSSFTFNNDLCYKRNNIESNQNDSIGGEEESKLKLFEKSGRRERKAARAKAKAYAKEAKATAKQVSKETRILKRKMKRNGEEKQFVGSGLELPESFYDGLGSDSHQFIPVVQDNESFEASFEILDDNDTVHKYSHNSSHALSQNTDSKRPNGSIEHTPSLRANIDNMYTSTSSGIYSDKSATNGLNLNYSGLELDDLDQFQTSNDMNNKENNATEINPRPTKERNIFKRWFMRRGGDGSIIIKERNDGDITKQ